MFKSKSKIGDGATQESSSPYLKSSGETMVHKPKYNELLSPSTSLSSNGAITPPLGMSPRSDTTTVTPRSDYYGSSPSPRSDSSGNLRGSGEQRLRRSDKKKLNGSQERRRFPLLEFPDSIILLVFERLSDIDKMALLFTCHRCYIMAPSLVFKPLFQDPHTNIDQFGASVIKSKFNMQVINDQFQEMTSNIYIINELKQLPLIPLHTTHIVFSNKFNKSIPPNSFPPSVTTIRFGQAYNQSILPNVLPDNLTTLIFGANFNKSLIPNSIPSSTKTIIFGFEYNQYITNGVLPLKLEKLIFGNEFNKDIDRGVIPNTCKYLEFGYSFNHNLVAGSIPNQLTTLKLGTNFKKTIENGVLPNTIIDLSGVGAADKQLPNIIPSSTTHLTLHPSFHSGIVNGTIPSHITHLTFGAKFNSPIKAGMIPSSVVSIKFGSKFNSEIDVGSLPPLLEVLEFGEHYNQPLKEGVLGNSISVLKFGRDFSHSLPQSVLQSKLTSLTIGKKFDTKGLFAGNSCRVPPTLTHLRIEGIEKLPIDQLPKSISSITLGPDFKGEISLPSWVKELSYTHDDERSVPVYISTLVNLTSIKMTCNGEESEYVANLQLRMLDKSHLLVYEEKSLLGGVIPITSKSQLIDIGELVLQRIALPILNIKS